MATPYNDPAVDRAVAVLQRKGGVDRVPAGISIGGCVDAHGTDRIGAMRRSAHAHTKGANRGWLCFKSAKPERLVTPTGQPTTLLAHEWSHIAVWGGHDRRWRAMMERVGHRADANKYGRKAA